jgi:VIT family
MRSRRTQNLRELAADERLHSRLLRQITGSTGGVEGGILARFEERHRSKRGNALRAALLGGNDGLVSNLSLVMGVADAALVGTTIVLTGLAGLFAGGISMALGEWPSVNSLRELHASLERCSAIVNRCRAVRTSIRPRDENQVSHDCCLRAIVLLSEITSLSSTEYMRRAGK